jgi:hypothetical protein
MEVPTSVAIFYLYTINLLMSTTYGVSRTSYSKCAGFCFEAPAGPRDHAARRISAKLSLSLAFSLMALCQSFSLEPPYYTKIEFHGHPHHRHTVITTMLPRFTGAMSAQCVYGGGAGSRTPVFPPLSLIVNN